MSKEDAALQWLNRLAAVQDWRISRVEGMSRADRAAMAERLAHLAYSWNSDPDHVADIMGEDGWDVRFANAAVCMLETL